MQLMVVKQRKREQSSIEQRREHRRREQRRREKSRREQKRRDKSRREQMRRDQKRREQMRRATIRVLKREEIQKSFPKAVVSGLCGGGQRCIAMT